MRLQALLTLAALPWMSNAFNWDEGLDGDLIGDRPAPTNFVGLDLGYGAEQVLKWSVPATNITLHKSRCKSHGEGLLRARQGTCPPGSVMTCPEQELPCCESTAAEPGPFICCPSGAGCCPTGDQCVGSIGCCAANLQVCSSLDSCCPPSTTCCGGNCCLGAFECVRGECVDPTISSRSVQSVQSVSSVASVSRENASRSQTSAPTNIPRDTNTVDVLANDPRISYQPADQWKDTASGASSDAVCRNNTRVGNQRGSKIRFEFEGSGVALYNVPNSVGSSITVTIDNQQQQAASGPIILNRSSSAPQCSTNTSFVRDDLDDVRHVLEIELVGSLNGEDLQLGVFELSGFRITGRNVRGTEAPSSGSNNAAIIGGSVGGVIGGLALLGLAIFFFRRRKSTKNKPPAAAAPVAAPPSAFVVPPSGPTSGPTSAAGGATYHSHNPSFSSHAPSGQYFGQPVHSQPSSMYGTPAGWQPPAQGPPQGQVPWGPAPGAYGQQPQSLSPPPSGQSWYYGSTPSSPYAGGGLTSPSPAYSGEPGTPTPLLANQGQPPMQHQYASPGGAPYPGPR